MTSFYIVTYMMTSFYIVRQQCIKLIEVFFPTILDLGGLNHYTCFGGLLRLKYFKFKGQYCICT
jgi:hypothetical protein